MKFLVSLILLPLRIIFLPFKLIGFIMDIMDDEGYEVPCDHDDCDDVCDRDD